MEALHEHVTRGWGGRCVGDQTTHLWWRLKEGEIPKKNKPKVAVLLIGTNDLFAAGCNSTDATVQQKVEEAIPSVVFRSFPLFPSLFS